MRDVQPAIPHDPKEWSVLHQVRPQDGRLLALYVKYLVYLYDARLITSCKKMKL